MTTPQQQEIKRLHSVVRERGNEIIRLRMLIEQEAVHFENRWGQHMGMSGNYVAKRLRQTLADPEDRLTAEIEEAERDNPLMRCVHGHALEDGGGEALEPPCGCRIED